jgi:adenosine kinase
MQLYVSGSLAYDRIMDFPGKFADHILPDKIHILNVCFTVSGLTENFGGTAGNIAYNLTLLGEHPLILASVGKDFDNYKAWLKQQNLSINGIRIIPEEYTACAYITTDKADNQITGFNPGAMKYASEYRFNNAHPMDSFAIIAPGNIEDMATYSRVYKKLEIPYIFDPGQSIPALSKEQLADMITGSFLLISNDYELELIKQITGFDQQEILKRTNTIITTMGEKGSLVCSTETKTKIPAAPTTAVTDPTGAGDAYRAGVIKGMIMGKGLIEAAYMGAICASYAVEHKGTQEHHYTPQQFWTRYQENYGARDSRPAAL